jgi:hypothetical protein
MHVLERLRLFLPLLAALLLGACASTIAPPGWLPAANEAQQQAYGAWIQVQYQTPEGLYEAGGELIAVTADSLYVLVNEQLLSCGKDSIAHTKLQTYDSRHTLLAGWTATGSVSTLSHGVMLIFSLPVWLASGIASTSQQSREPILEYPAAIWDEQIPYARFPQGWPPLVAPSALQSKPGSPLTGAPRKAESVRKARKAMAKHPL